MSLFIYYCFSYCFSVFEMSSKSKNQLFYYLPKNVILFPILLKYEDSSSWPNGVIAGPIVRTELPGWTDVIIPRHTWHIFEQLISKFGRNYSIVKVATSATFVKKNEVAISSNWVLIAIKM